MEPSEEDDDLKLVKASVTLLADLEDALPKLLWKPAKSGNGRKVHTQVRRRDLDYATKLIEPFQSEPQLLDARLKYILPPIVDAYLAYIQLPEPPGRAREHLDLETAVCFLLYTLCKVRGYKVILGFLSNEPRYLEPILHRLEETIPAGGGQKYEWQVSYILSLWLSHLLLTPFDLASVSSPSDENGRFEDDDEWLQNLPSIALSIVGIGNHYLSTSTKANDAAAMLLVRLVRRPDMQQLGLGDGLVDRVLCSLKEGEADASLTVYERLGTLRLLLGTAASPEVSHLVPEIYRACQRLSEDANSLVTSNAVAKKLVVKIFRDVAILSIRSPDIDGPLLSFFETTSVLEDVIDYLLRSLGDRDTPVRFAAAKAISLIVLELDPEMRQEVIQAVLDTFKEDMPRSTSQALDFRTANALRWHGLTLCLAHTLFKRSASPSQLPDIATALISALQFEQRTATGSTIGTNVRDAANFGIWSLSRRYTTEELLSVDTTAITSNGDESIIQHLAIELVLSSCLDPAGNVRRGSSAALQELIGRHPNQVKEGIALVQIVDYQAVGLRARAMVDVAVRATELNTIYFKPVQRALIEWRGLGSPDVASREAAALSIAKLIEQGFEQATTVVEDVLRNAQTIRLNDTELLHGFVEAVALIFEKAEGLKYGPLLLDPSTDVMRVGFATLLTNLDASKEFNARMLRSELPSAIARMLAAYCSFQLKQASAHNDEPHAGLEATVDFATIEALTVRLLIRGEETIREAIPPLARSLLALKRKAGVSLGCLGSQTLTKQVAIDGAKSTLQGAGRAMALGALAPLYESGLRGSKAIEIVSTLGGLTQAMSVDWRVIGVRALQLAIEGSPHGDEVEASLLEDVVQAVHRGLNDYTIDERGDAGSLVRLQGIVCAAAIFAKCDASKYDLNAEPLQILQADILRLSLEKLDRVRLAAAQCQHQHLTQTTSTTLDIPAVSTPSYFNSQFHPLASPTEPDWKHTAILSGAISAAGISSESLLQASRSALISTLSTVTDEHLSRLMTIYTHILKISLASPTSPLTTPALMLLAFLLDMRVVQRLAYPPSSSSTASSATPSSPPFKWLNLLSTVQKAHHKSNDIPRIVAAVSVYRGLAEVEAIMVEVLKKLLGMLKTNPYPRVRVMVAETLLVAVGDGEESGKVVGEAREVKEMLRGGDWMGDRKGNESIVRRLEEWLLGTG